MGRGSYLGGSTIIKPGSSWYSGLDRPAGTKTKVKSVRRAPDRCTAEEMAFLDSVILAEFTGRPVPLVPMDMKASAMDRIRSAGGVLAWSRSRSEFKTVCAKFERIYGPISWKSKPGSKILTEPEKMLDGLRKTLVDRIANAHSSGLPMPELPKKLRQELADISSKPDGLLEWARRHKSLLNPKRRKLLDGSKLKTDDLARSQFLNSLIAADVNGRTLPMIPKRLRATLDPEITKAGGIRQWAAAQDAAPQIREEADTRRRNKLKGKAVARPAPPSVLDIPTSQRKVAAIRRRERYLLDPADARELEDRLTAQLHPGYKLTAYEINQAEIKLGAMLKVEIKRRFDMPTLPTMERFPDHAAVGSRVMARLRAEVSSSA